MYILYFDHIHTPITLFCLPFYFNVNLFHCEVNSTQLWPKIISIEKKTDLRVLFAIASSRMVTVQSAFSQIIVIMTYEYWLRNKQQQNCIAVHHLTANSCVKTILNSISENLSFLTLILQVDSFTLTHRILWSIWEARHFNAVLFLLSPGEPCRGSDIVKGPWPGQFSTEGRVSLYSHTHLLSPIEVRD